MFTFIDDRKPVGPAQKFPAVFKVHGDIFLFTGGDGQVRVFRG